MLEIDFNIGLGEKRGTCKVTRTNWNKILLRIVKLVDLTVYDGMDAQPIKSISLMCDNEFKSFVFYYFFDRFNQLPWCTAISSVLMMRILLSIMSWF